MNWDNAQLVDQLCYDMVLADWPRSQNRARIQNLANGDPPYTDQQVEENNIEVNINDLTHTRLCHDARAQFSNGFMKTGNFATARTDMGAVSKRSEHGAIVTREWNRPMKRSIEYFEANRAKFGMNVLHGIAPAVWQNEDGWCTKPMDVGDILIPGKTLLGFQNLPFFAIRRSFTGIELEELTRKAVRDPGWNMDMVNAALKWIDESTTTLMGNNWPEVWSPEKVAERQKEGGYLASDNCPTLECFDVYGYIGDDPDAGWVRRIILDSWSTPTLAGISSYMMTRKPSGYGGQDGVRSFLFSSGNRKVAQTWQNIISFQFADLSAVFPARYHSIRSLGWMTFASCFLGNRMRCKFYEAVLEALMQYFKVQNMDDVQRALKLNLVNRGFIDDTLKPLPPNERWQVNAQLVELGLSDNMRVTQENSASWVQNQNYSRDRTEKTKFQVMAEMNAMTSLVSAALNQAYQYQAWEDREIFRRFMKKNSTDIDVLKFRANVLRQGVPEDLLEADYWDIEHERVYGGGNKTMEMTIAQWLMEQRDKFDPEPQRKILRDSVLAVTDDAPLANELVPENPVKITDSVHDAQNSVGSLMALEDMEPMTGENHIEIVNTLIHSMTQRVSRVLQQGGVTDAKEIAGLQNMAKYIGKHVAIIAQDETEKERVKQYGDALGKLMNYVKSFAQRLQEQMQKAAQQNGGAQMDPKDAAKVKAIATTGAVKDQIATKRAAQKAAQDQLKFERKIQQDAVLHRAELAKKDIEAASNIRRNRLTQIDEGEKP